MASARPPSRQAIPGVLPRALRSGEVPNFPQPTHPETAITPNNGVERDFHYIEVRPLAAGDIEGFGVFALRRIAAGYRFNTPYGGVVLESTLYTDLLANRPPELQYELDHYGYQPLNNCIITEYYTPLGDRLWPSFVNHAPGSLANVRFTTVNRNMLNPRPFIRPIRDIAPDEELLVDYGPVFFNRTMTPSQLPTAQLEESHLLPEELESLRMDYFLNATGREVHEFKVALEIRPRVDLLEVSPRSSFPALREDGRLARSAFEGKSHSDGDEQQIQRLTAVIHTGGVREPRSLVIHGPASTADLQPAEPPAQSPTEVAPVTPPHRISTGSSSQHPAFDFQSPLDGGGRIQSPSQSFPGTPVRVSLPVPTSPVASLSAFFRRDSSPEVLAPEPSGDANGAGDSHSASHQGGPDPGVSGTSTLVQGQSRPPTPSPAVTTSPANPSAVVTPGSEVVSGGVASSTPQTPQTPQTPSPGFVFNWTSSGSGPASSPTNSAPVPSSLGDSAAVTSPASNAVPYLVLGNLRFEMYVEVPTPSSSDSNTPAVVYRWQVSFAPGSIFTPPVLALPSGPSSSPGSPPTGPSAAPGSSPPPGSSTPPGPSVPPGPNGP